MNSQIFLLVLAASVVAAADQSKTKDSLRSDKRGYTQLVNADLASYAYGAAGQLPGSPLRALQSPHAFPVAVPQPYPVSVPRPYPVAVPRPYPVSVPRPVPVPVPVPRPYPVPVPHPVPVASSGLGFSDAFGLGFGMDVGDYGLAAALGVAGKQFAAGKTSAYGADLGLNTILSGDYVSALNQGSFKNLNLDRPSAYGLDIVAGALAGYKPSDATQDLTTFKTAGVAQDLGAYKPGGAVQDLGAYKPSGAVQDLGAYKPGGAVQDLGANKPGGAVQDLGAYKPGGTVQDLGTYKPGGAGQDLAAYRPGAATPEGLPTSFQLPDGHKATAGPVQYGHGPLLDYMPLQPLPGGVSFSVEVPKAPPQRRPEFGQVYKG